MGWRYREKRRRRHIVIFSPMIDPDNDPILSASSINSEDYWFLKVSGVENGNADNAANGENKSAGEGDGKCADTPAKDKE